MNSATLAALIGGERWIGEEKARITASEIYFAATNAQKEILARTIYLEGKGQLAFVAGQDQYTFPVQTISGVSVVSGTVQVQINGHPFNTNDEAVIWGVLGSVEVNGRWKLTKVNSNFVSLNGLTTATAYVSGGTCAHILTGARELLPSGIKLISDANGSLSGVLEKKTKSWIELQRNVFGTSGNLTPSTPTNAAVVHFYEEYTDPLTIGLLGTPQTTMITEPIFYRKHIDGYDDISATVNPILPSLYDMPLQMGTYKYVFMFRPEKGAALETEKWEKRFELELVKFNRVHGKRKMVQQFNDTTIEWR